MSKLSSVFLGTPEFALSSLEAAYRETRLLAVISQPDRPRGRGQRLSPSPVKARALELGIPVFTPKSLRKPSPELSELQSHLANANPELLIVTAYGNLLPQNFLDIPRVGPINVHASLLPRWRGAAPIQRALEAGDQETGVSLQKMVLELDAGDVLAESRLMIADSWDAAELMSQLSVLGGELLSTYLKTLAQSPLLRGQAQDPRAVTLAAKISKEEAAYRSTWAARDFHNRVRAFSVWPKVEARCESVRFKILKTRFGSGARQPLAPGSVRLREGHVLVQAADGEAVEILAVQPENRSAQDAMSFFRNLEQSLARQDSLQILEPESE